MRFDGFSFVEVMVALVILSISLVILMESQTRSMDLVARSHAIDEAVTLASEKMAELTQQAQDKGLSSLKESASGEFDQEKYAGYKWKYTVVSVQTPNFAAMMGMVANQDDKKEDDAASQNAALFAGPLQQIEKIWTQSLKELHLDVTWTDGAREKDFELVTHLIAPEGIGQIQGFVGALTGGRSK